METKITVRIYFESGLKTTHISFWQKIWDNSFSTELIKRAKTANLEQAVCFNITKGYLNNQAIRWNTEIRSPDYPQCMEITDTVVKINNFLKAQTGFLLECAALIVSNETIIVRFKNETNNLKIEYENKPMA